MWVFRGGCSYKKIDSIKFKTSAYRSLFPFINYVVYLVNRARWLDHYYETKFEVSGEDAPWFFFNLIEFKMAETRPLFSSIIVLISDKPWKISMKICSLWLTGPDGSFVSTGTCNLEVTGSNPGRAGYLSSWLCICSASICSKAECTVLPMVLYTIKNPWSHSI